MCAMSTSLLVLLIYVLQRSVPLCSLWPLVPRWLPLLPVLWSSWLIVPRVCVTRTLLLLAVSVVMHVLLVSSVGSILRAI